MGARWGQWLLLSLLGPNNMWCRHLACKPVCKLWARVGTNIRSSTSANGRASLHNTDANTPTLMMCLVALYAALSPPKTPITPTALHWLISVEPASSASPKPVHGPSAQSGDTRDFMFGAEWRGFIEHFRVPSVHILCRAAYFNKLDLIMSQFMLKGAMHKSVWKWKQCGKDLHSIKLGTDCRAKWNSVGCKFYLQLLKTLRSSNTGETTCVHSRG